MVKAAAEDMNGELEVTCKDERKQRREIDLTVTQNQWPCCELSCAFVAQSRAGLVNHTRQKHTTAAPPAELYVLQRALS